MKHKPNFDNLLIKMAGLCANAEQCSADIHRKILKYGFSHDEVSKMLTYLIANKYIDDARYSRAYAVDKVRFSKWGKMKVRMGLHAKGISDSVISQALECIPDNEYNEAIEKVLLAKVRSIDLKDVKDRQKLYRHMVSRGFESQLIISAIRKYLAKSDDQMD